MKRSTILLSGICAVALIAGAIWYKTGSNKANVSAYWNKKTELNTKAPDGTLPLIKAIIANDMDAVKYFIEKGAKINIPDKTGLSALDFVLKNGNTEIAQLLTKNQPISLDSPQYLSEAIDSGQANMVEFILKNGGNANATLEIKGKYRPDEELNYQDARVITPLKKAINEDKAAIVKVLLDHGAEGAEYFLKQNLTQKSLPTVKNLIQALPNIREVNVRGSDILTASTAEGSPELISYLLEKNTGDANSALERTIFFRNKDNNYIPTIDMFLKAGAMPKETSIEYSLKKGEHELFKKLDSCLVDGNIKLSSTNQTLIRYALDHNYNDVVSYLLKKPVDIWAKEADGKSLLETAIAQINEHPEIYAALKSKIKDINEAGYEGETLLMLIAKAGNKNEFQKILDSGGDIWARDLSQKTVMMYAAEGGNTSILDDLLHKGDSLSSRDKENKNALMYAAFAGQNKFLTSLIRHGLSIKEKDNDGRTPIMYAARGGKAETLNFLLDEGASVVESDNNDKTVAMYAAESGDLATFNIINERGFNALTQDKDNVSLLTYAVKGNNPDIVDIILKRGADTHIADKYGYQPIVYALKNGNKEIAEKVGLYSPDTLRQYTSDNGRNLAMYAIDGGNQDLIRWAVDRMRNIHTKKDNNGQTFVMLAAKYGRPDVLRDILTQRGSATSRDNNGKSVLMYAAESENAVNMINTIKNADEETVNLRDKQGKTALMYAVGGKYNPIIKQQRLIQHNADVDAKDNNGKTVLMYLVGNQEAKVDPQSVRELLAQGVNINTKDNNGKTALMYAAENPNAGISIIEILLEAGAKLNDTDNDQNTILMYALKSDDISKFRLLLEKNASTSGISPDKLKDSCFNNAVKTLLKN